mgnify:CR=1 FL=1|jgi:Zn-finger nucleic acid-binding protein
MSHCPKCQRKAPPNRDTCLYCGGSLAVESKAGHALRCPRCHSGMTAETVDGLELDVCYGCGGIWYDRDELKARLKSHMQLTGEAGPDIAQTSWKRAPDADISKVEYLPCPHCQKQMTRQNFGRASGVIVDVCGYHGLFLDAGEFQRIADFESKGGSVKGRQKELDHLKTRAKEQRRDETLRHHRDIMTAQRRHFSILDLF